MQPLTAEAIIEHLDLLPHPEGGYFRETFRDRRGHEGRPHSTAIYYLLPAGEVSHWHRVDVAEVWHWYAGGPLELTISPDGTTSAAHRLGPDLLNGERPQLVVPAHAWQTARPLGDWTLIGCTVSPAFLFDAFELAPPDWRPTPPEQSAG